MKGTDVDEARAAAAAEARRARTMGAPRTRGAAIVTTRGHVVAAPETSDPGDGTGGCAERAALLLALLQGHRRFRELHLAGGAGGRGDAGPPCGSCLQILFEFAPGLRVHWGTAARPVDGGTVRSLLPGAFGPRSLRSSRRDSGIASARSR